MRKHLLAASILGLSALLLTASGRAETFSFTSSGVGYDFSASGTLTGVADPTVAGAFDITGVTGSVNTIPLSLYGAGTATATSPANVNFNGSSYTYDNVIYTGANGSLDLYGLLFSDGGDHTNFFYDGTGYMFTNDESNTASNTTTYSINFSVTDTTPAAVTPEPSSIALLGTGLLGLGGILRKRFVA